MFMCFYKQVKLFYSINLKFMFRLKLIKSGFCFMYIYIKNVRFNVARNK